MVVSTWNTFVRLSRQFTCDSFNSGIMSTIVLPLPESLEDFFPFVRSSPIISISVCAADSCVSRSLTKIASTVNAFSQPGTSSNRSVLPVSLRLLHSFAVSPLCSPLPFWGVALVPLPIERSSTFSDMIMGWILETIFTSNRNDEPTSIECMLLSYVVSMRISDSRNLGRWTRVVSLYISSESVSSRNSVR
uniref:Uncharacterized protein n=1 Tax=Anopheles coluzzii TaxID=1518534 RepID=A0A8W7P6N6_ANOCL